MPVNANGQMRPSRMLSHVRRTLRRSPAIHSAAAANGTMPSHSQSLIEGNGGDGSVA
jgi:hypothetical protein